MVGKGIYISAWSSKYHQIYLGIELNYCYLLRFRDVEMTEPLEACDEVSDKLWVDRYAPRTYTDLLSEEVTYFH